MNPLKNIPKHLLNRVSEERREEFVKWYFKHQFLKSWVFGFIWHLHFYFLFALFFLIIFYRYAKQSELWRGVISSRLLGAFIISFFAVVLISPLIKSIRYRLVRRGIVATYLLTFFWGLFLFLLIYLEGLKQKLNSGVNFY